MGDRRIGAPNSIVCRPRADRDLAVLAVLWVRAWQQAMPNIDFEARRDWFRDHLARLEANGFKTICAEDRSGQILGFAALNPQTHILDQLAVAPEAWGGGIAAHLLAEARRISPSQIILDVNCDNARAIRFYEREKFKRIGDGVNALSGLKTWRMRWLPVDH